MIMTNADQELTLDQLNDVNGGSYGYPAPNHPEPAYIARWNLMRTLDSQMSAAFTGFSLPSIL